MTAVTTRIQTAVAVLCVLALLLAVAGLLLAPSRGAAGWWCLSLLCSGGCLIDLIRSRRRGDIRARRRR